MNTLELIIIIFGVSTMIIPFLWIIIIYFDKDIHNKDIHNKDIHNYERIQDREIIKGNDVKIDYLIKRPYKIIQNKEIGNVCSICLEIIGDSKCELGCKHSYHFDCIQEWAFLKNNNNCPECRRNIIIYNFKNYDIV